MVRAKGPTGLNPQRYLGVEAVTPPNLTIQTRVPTANDSIGYNIGDLWLRYRAGFPNAGTSSDLYILVGVERDVAHWVNFIDGVGLQTLTGDAGGVVSPDGADNINILGDAASNLTTLGNPGANSITVNTVSGNPVGTDYITDNGTAFPNAAGVLNVITNQAAQACGQSVLFSGAGNIVSLTVTDGAFNTTIGDSAGSIAITTGQDNTGVGSTVLSNFTSGSRNSALGLGALNALTTGSSNTAVGIEALNSLTTGSNNVAIGDQALFSITTTDSNVAIGLGALNTATTASNNVAIGLSAGQSIGTGTGNVLIGSISGTNLFGANSNNILISNVGDALGESDTIRIGTEGTQTATYMAGINGVTVANPAMVVINSVTGQLGTQFIGNVGFLAETTVPTLNVTGDGTSYSVINDGILVNIGGGYNGITGIFTAPQNGYYYFSGFVQFTNLLAAHTAGYAALSLNGGGGVFGMVCNVGALRCLGGLPGTGNTMIPFSGGFSMTAGETMQPVVLVDNSTKTVTLEAESNFTGFMVFPF